MALPFRNAGPSNSGELRVPGVKVPNPADVEAVFANDDLDESSSREVSWKDPLIHGASTLGGSDLL